ncbi:MAG: CAP domain-containing protein [Solirubrobacteraceae bacterium]
MSQVRRSSRTTHAVVILAGTIALAATTPAMAGSSVQSATEGRFVELLNAERANRGLKALRPAAVLTAIADDYAAGNAKRGDISHEHDAGYITRARAAGCSKYSWDGPVLAMNSAGMTASGALRQWLGSPGHRQVILDAKSTRIGVGIKGSQAVAFVLDCPASLAAAATADDGGAGGSGSGGDGGNGAGTGGAGTGSGTGGGAGTTSLPIKVGRPRARGSRIRVGIHVRSGKQRLRLEARRGKRVIRTTYRRLAKRKRAYRVNLRVPAGRWRVTVRLTPLKGRSRVVKAGTVRIRR